MPNGILNGMNEETIQIDKAGRVVIPKSLRDQFNLLPGDKLHLSVEDNGIRLEPAESGGELSRNGSVLVFTGGFSEKITTAKINKMVAEGREARMVQATRSRKK